MDVYFYEVFAEEQAALKQFLPKAITADFTEDTIQLSGHKKPPAPLLSIRTQSRIPEGWHKDLKGVLSRSKGFDHLEPLKKKDITVGALPGYCARSVAESAFLMALALLRKLPQQKKQFRTFNRDGLTGKDALHKKALVVGVGDIGSEIVRICEGFGLEARGVDIDPDNKPCPLMSLEEGAAWADIIFAALPLDADTHNLLNGDTLKRARKGLIVVNVGRGEVTPLKDLKNLIATGQLAGIGLDVYENESTLADALRKGVKNEITEEWLDFSDDSRVICTPHNAFNSQEALEEKARLTVKSIEKFLKERKFKE